MIESIIKTCGLQVTTYNIVYGGDINHSFCIQTPTGKFFLKTNDASAYPGMFEKEALGLNALRNNSTLLIPKVIRHGIENGQQFLLLEWLEKGPPGPNFWKQFGTELAKLHQHKQPYFGWEQDNFIGSLPQLNTKHNSWSTFYAECRIMPLVRTLKNNGLIAANDVTLAEKLCANLDKLFPIEKPCIVHGDLWSGNFMATENGSPALFDPAIYFGHREMDIGMTLLFGGFAPEFYESYNETYPLEHGWKQRVPLTQFYPLLVHAVLFGGHYIGGAMAITKRFS